MSRRSAYFTASPVLTQHSQGPQKVASTGRRQSINFSCISPLIPEFRRKIQETLVEMNLTGNESYIRMKQLANEVGRKREYDLANGLLSKFVHATGISILTNREVFRFITPLLVFGGCDYCSQILDLIQVHLKTAGLPSF